MKVIKPVDETQYYCKHSSTTVFLAGSIEMGRAEDWQSVIPQQFTDRSDVVFFNPRRDDWDSSWEQKASNPQFNHQVNWELNKLEEADIIFMYFSPKTASPISLLELGIFKKSNIIVCCPEGFYRKGNVDIVCTRFKIPIYEKLETAIGALRTLLKDVK